MGQGQSHPQPSGSPTKWLDGAKLAILTSAVAALQYLRYQLTKDDREQRRCRGDRHRTPILDGLPVEFRRACVSLIDYHAMPLLVDQWRLKLVSVLLNPDNGPVLQEDGDRRQSVLASLNDYQQQRRAADVPTSHPRQPAPMPAAQPSVPSAPPTAAGDSSHVPYPDLGQYDRHSTAPPSRPQQAEPYRTRHQPEPYHAEPYPAEPYQAEQQAEPSAPPMPHEWSMGTDSRAATSSSSSSKKQVPEKEECHICMEAQVEVEIDSCHHAMCIECARAVCSMPNRAPQCPFCRGAIMSMSPRPVSV